MLLATLTSNCRFKNLDDFERDEADFWRAGHLNGKRKE